ncbi:MAG: hypothetical protein ACXADX_19555 [Candidatus Hodarchaeales archaeon]|jgi:hypothetical protein
MNNRQDNLDTVQKARDRRLRVIKIARDALSDSVDPLTVDVGELVEIVASTRTLASEREDVAQGVYALSALAQVREKQDRLMLEIAKGHDALLSREQLIQLVNLLADRTAMAKLAQLIAKKNLVWSLPRANPRINLERIERQMEEVAPKIDLEAESSPIDPEVEQQILDLSKGKSPEFRQRTLTLLSQIQQHKKKGIPLLSFILAKTYQETLLRLECVSFLASSGMIQLAQAGKGEQKEAGKFVILKGTAKGQRVEIPSSMVLGLTWDEWTHLQDVVRDKRGLKARKKLSLLD